MALVGQEPTLFDISIGENVRYGIEEHQDVTQEQVEEACKSANIHKFIMGLPQGYDTRVGDKGSKYSDLSYVCVKCRSLGADLLFFEL